MTCEQVRDLLPLYADDDLEAMDREAVSRHLDGCPECRARLALDRDLAAALAKLAEPPETSARNVALRRRVMGRVGADRRWRPMRRAAGRAANLVGVAAGVALAVVLVAALVVVGKPIVEERIGQRNLPAGGPAIPTPEPSWYSASPVAATVHDHGKATRLEPGSEEFARIASTANLVLRKVRAVAALANPWDEAERVKREGLSLELDYTGNEVRPSEGEYSWSAVLIRLDQPRGRRGQLVFLGRDRYAGLVSADADAEVAELRRLLGIPEPPAEVGPAVPTVASEATPTGGKEDEVWSLVVRSATDVSPILRPASAPAGTESVEATMHEPGSFGVEYRGSGKRLFVGVSGFNPPIVTDEGEQRKVMVRGQDAMLQVTSKARPAEGAYLWWEEPGRWVPAPGAPARDRVFYLVSTVGFSPEDVLSIADSLRPAVQATPTPGAAAPTPSPDVSPTATPPSQAMRHEVTAQAWEKLAAEVRTIPVLRPTYLPPRLLAGDPTMSVDGSPDERYLVIYGDDEVSLEFLGTAGTSEVTEVSRTETVGFRGGVGHLVLWEKDGKVVAAAVSWREKGGPAGRPASRPGGTSDFVVWGRNLPVRELLKAAESLRSVGAVPAGGSDEPVPEPCAFDKGDVQLCHQPFRVVWRDRLADETGFRVELAYDETGDRFTHTVPANATGFVFPTEAQPGLAEPRGTCSPYRNLTLGVYAVTPSGEKQVGGTGVTAECSDVMPPATPTAVSAGTLRFGAPRDLFELPPSGPIYRLSPDGQWLSYQEPSRDAGDGKVSPGKVLARNLGTGETVTLWSGSARDFDHYWFPDGRQVLVLAGVWSQGGQVLVKPLGSGPARVLAKAPDGSQGLMEAAISPDGRRVAFAVAYDASPAPVPKIGVEVVGIDGSGRRRIAEPEHFVGHLAWSPDSRQVVYFKGKGGTPPDDGEAYAASADGPVGPPRLLRPRARPLAWSRDGRQALWVTEPPDPDGHGDLTVTGWPSVGAARTVATGVDAFGADWVGGGVVFAREGALYLTSPAEGGAPRRLTPEGESASAPKWVEGRGIVYEAALPDSAGARLRLLPMLPSS